jgi:hypothetical protein
VYSNTHSGVLKSPFALCSDTLVVTSVNDDVRTAIKRLRSTKSVGLDGTPSFVAKGCSEIFVPLLKFSFNLSLSTQTFRTACKKKQPLSRFLKKATRPLLATTGLLPF